MTLIELAKSVGDYFQLNRSEMEKIIIEVKGGVKNWRMLADEIRIPRQEQELMSNAFELV
jgi:serine/threonine-protein kinase HipA